MHVTEVNDTATLEQYRDAWSSLLDEVSDPSTVFTNPGWTIEWWKHLGGDGHLTVLLLMHDGQLVGIAPLAIWRWPFAASPVRVLRFVGTGKSDHLDICIRPEFRTRGLPVLCDYMRHHLHWHTADFLDIPEDSPNLPVMRSEMGAKMNLAVSLRAIVCPYLRLGSKSWPDFYAGQRSKSTRKDLERRHRRLAEQGQLEFRRHEQSDEIQSIFPQLFALYAKRWDGRFLSSSFAGQRERNFYPAMALDFARQGRLDLITIQLNEQVLAFSLGITHNNKFTWLITAHDPAYSKYFPGELLLVHLLQSVFERGDMAEFDFTRGEEDYKYKWADSERHNMRLLVARPSPFGLLPLVATSTYALLRRQAKRSAFLRRIKLELPGKLRSIMQSYRTKAQ